MPRTNTPILAGLIVTCIVQCDLGWRVLREEKCLTPKKSSQGHSTDSLLDFCCRGLPGELKTTTRTTRSHTPGDSDLFGLNFFFESSPGDSNVQPKLKLRLLTQGLGNPMGKYRAAEYESLQCVPG